MICKNKNCQHPFLNHKKCYHSIEARFHYICMIDDCICFDYEGDNI
jgi:hypothetical protein